MYKCRFHKYIGKKKCPTCAEQQRWEDIHQVHKIMTPAIVSEIRKIARREIEKKFRAKSPSI